MSWHRYPPYVSAANRRANALSHVADLEAKGLVPEPIKVEGRRIAQTFWAKAWCEHIESFSDYRTRLERGQTYVRNGYVVDLKIEPCKVKAIVAGTDVYEVNIKFKPLKAEAWNRIRRECRGKVGSLVELLQGKLAGGVMRIVTQRSGGLFPSPEGITMSCSCPDDADMCKHVAAVMYGIGARLDTQPELLFKLRRVDHLELIEHVDAAKLAMGRSDNVIDAGELEDIFGIELEAPTAPVAAGHDPGQGVEPGRGVSPGVESETSKSNGAVKQTSRRPRG